MYLILTQLLHPSFDLRFQGLQGILNKHVVLNPLYMQVLLCACQELLVSLCLQPACTTHACTKAAKQLQTWLSSKHQLALRAVLLLVWRSHSVDLAHQVCADAISNVVPAC